jgi:hypothetical protein
MFQRLINPIDGFRIRVISIIILLPPFFGLISGGYRSIQMWFFAFIMIFVDIVFFGKHLLETIVTILERDPSRCIVVEAEKFGIGHKEPEYWIPRKSLKVYEGLAGTHLIRIGDKFGRCFIVSKNIISFSELKKLIETNSASDEPESDKYSRGN